MAVIFIYTLFACTLIVKAAKALNKAAKTVEILGEVLGKGKTLALKVVEKIPKIHVEEVYVGGLRTAEGVEVGGFRYFAVKVGEKEGGKVAKESGKATGIGKTGEGIPLEDVKPHVLEQIHPDDNAAYGYSPNKGSRYEKSDFTDVENAQASREIRQDYLESSKKLQNHINEMKSQGSSNEEIARYAVDERNQEKVLARAKMTPEAVAKLAEGNIERYQNPIGPTAEGVFDKTKASLIKNGRYQSDDQVWDEVISKSMKKDDEINTLLGIVH